MNNQYLSSCSGLMLALDVEEFEIADAILSENNRFVDAVKLGSTILTSPKAGYKTISHIKKKYSLPILVDSKLKDVPHVLLSTARSLADHGASAFTCWADIGEESLRMLLDNLDGVIDLVVLTALTNLPQPSQEDNARNNILLAVKCGCRFIQIPGNFPALIKWARSNIPPDIKILSCGIGTQGGIVGEAIRYGANLEIIGRKLLDCADEKEMHNTFINFHNIIHASIKNNSEQTSQN